MGKKKRVDHSKADDGAIHSPFAGLAALRETLPSAPEPKAGTETPCEGHAPNTAESGLGFQRCVLRRERSGRKGKTVVKIENTGLGPDALLSLAKTLKKKLGCGATVEGEAVVVLGDLEDRLADVLATAGVGRIQRGSGAKKS